MYTPTSTLQNLIIHLQQRGILKTKHLINAMLTTDRADFVLPTDKLHAYFDTPLSIGHNATISAPHMHAFALELLKDTLLPTHKVLDIGSGSGILCVLFSKAMNNKGTVYGVEHIHELVEFSLNNIKKNPQLIGNKLVSIIEGDGRIGLKEQAPYNCIHGCSIRGSTDCLSRPISEWGKDDAATWSSIWRSENNIGN
jgi:protein-L-isoaspartate(D-aspartate) O-methyltransferase